MTTRQDLVNFALRQLGAPLLNIEIADEQIEDNLNEALEYYHEYHFDGIERDVFKYQVTATDITNGYIDIPEDIVSVLRVMPTTGIFTQDYLFDGKYQFYLTELKNLSSFNTSNFFISMQYLQHVDFMLNKGVNFRFHRRMNKLILDSSVGEHFKEGSWIVLEVYRNLDPEQYPSVYKDRWLRRYFTALLKKQWGQNLSKYEGMTLPGGITINGTQLKQEAMNELQELELELRDICGPLEFQVG